MGTITISCTSSADIIGKIRGNGTGLFLGDWIGIKIVTVPIFRDSGTGLFLGDGIGIKIVTVPIISLQYSQPSS